MIINNDLDSTLIPFSTRQFFFLLREVYGDTKETLSTDCEGQRFVGGCPPFSFLPIWIQTALSPLRESDSWRDYSELIIRYLFIIAADYTIIHTELSATECLNHYGIT